MINRILEDVFKSVLSTGLKKIIGQKLSFLAQLTPDIAARTGLSIRYKKLSDNSFLRLFIIFCFINFSGCTWTGINNPFTHDPLTGGVNRSTSSVLNLPIPGGFQTYPSHSRITSDLYGEKSGLETLRGYVNENAAMLAMFNTLNSAGWQIRLDLRDGDRICNLYQKGSRYAIITCRKQGILTIMEIWTGASLPDGYIFGTNNNQPQAPAQDYGNTGSTDAIPGEEYGPLEKGGAAPGTVEKWGGGFEERPL